MVTLCILSYVILLEAGSLFIYFFFISFNPFLMQNTTELTFSRRRRNKAWRAVFIARKAMTIMISAPRRGARQMLSLRALD